MNIKFIFLVLPFVLVNKENAMAMTIGEFIQQAERNDPNYQMIVNENRKKNYVVDEGLPSREFLISVEAEKGVSSEDDDDTETITSSISKDIIETGTSVSVSHTQSLQPDREEDVTEIRLEQDLVKNFLGRDVRLEKTSLKNEVEAIHAESLELYEEYLNEILSEFLDYQQANIDVQLSQEAMNRVERLKSNVLQKFRKKIASQSDVDQASLQVLLRKEDLIEKRRIFQEKKETIAEILGSAENLPQSESLFEKIFTFFSEKKSELPKIENLRSTRALELRRQIADNDLVLAKRDTHASLRFVAGYDIDNSERFSSTVNREETILGLKVELPLWNTTGQAGIKSAANASAESAINLQVNRKDKSTLRRQLLVRLEQQRDQRELNAEKVRLAKRVYQAELKRYNYGKISLTDLMELESNIVNYRLDQQAVEIEYGKSILSWLELNDQLLDFRNSVAGKSLDF